jgi:ankyrin repeat protein
MSLLGASRRGDLEEAKEWLQKGVAKRELEISLLEAVLFGNIEIVQILLDNGADSHKNNDDVLRKAVCYGYLEVTKLLLDNGANIQFINDYDYDRLYKQQQHKLLNFLNNQRMLDNLKELLE